MTKDNWNLPNNIIWLSKEDGVAIEGWYDFNGGTPTYYEETESYGHEVNDFLLVSKEDIDKGFDTWSEDVYTWELRKI
jgi:hypothetical protein